MPSLVTQPGQRVIDVLWREYPYWKAARLSGFLVLYVEGRDDLKQSMDTARWNNRLSELNRVGINPETVELNYGEGRMASFGLYLARKAAFVFSGRILGA